jgi:MoaA/NifB/PqqE/SkfB family radical SAM enzyme
MLSALVASATGYRQFHPPKIVSMAITSRCNLRCVMCDHGIQNIEKQDFDPGLIDQIGDFIGRADVVDLTGLGEPLLSDLFWKILARFPRNASLPPALMFNTNGLLLTQKNVDRILASRMRRIRVSIDSPDPDTFKSIRDADFEAVKAGAKRLLEARATLWLTAPIIGIEMTTMRRNLHQMRAMIDLTCEIGADFVEFWQLNEKAPELAQRWRAEAAGVKFLYSDEALSGIDRAEVEAARKDAEDYAEGLGVGAAFVMLDGGGTTNYPREVFADNPKIAWRAESIRCNLPWQELRSDYTGGVTACCWGPRPIGNLRESTMQEIWNSPEIREMRRDLVAGRVPERCRGAACGMIGQQ